MDKIKDFFKIFSPWFNVDSRSLGIFRIFLGLLCLIDITRRWNYIEVFYTDNSILSSSTSTSYYKMFNLLSTFTKPWEVYTFFFIGIVFSISLIIGYRTKLSQIICTLVIISIHTKAIILENAGDMFFNCILVWALFLPLGIAYSVDSLLKSLNKYKENNIEDLNNRDFGINKPKTIFSLAYFAILYQISAIYFFTGINKSGYDWSDGSAVYKLYQLDTFLTPVGFYLREYITHPISAIFTYSTLYLELSVPLLLFIPFYSYIFRTIAVVALFFFHLMIRLSVKVGMFSFTMISTYPLLIDKKVYSFINKLIEKYITKNKQYVLFYDSDCGFCHLTVRIIKRLDIFHRIVYADKDFQGVKPSNYNDLYKDTAILYDRENQKQWIKTQAFGKIILLLPFGFLFGWIFLIPIVSNFYNFIYDTIANNRSKISSFLGQKSCEVKINNNHNIIEENEAVFIKYYIFSKQLSASIVVLILLIASFNYILVANDSVNDFMKKNGYKKFKYNRTLKKICYYPRMIQRWNMFSPTVLATDKTIIVEATLFNGEVINPFTGEEPYYDDLHYTNIWTGHNQLWRKFFSRISKKHNKKYIPNFEKWLTRRANDYFDETLDGQKIKSVKIWSLTQRNPDINSSKQYKTYKTLLRK